MIGYTQVLEGGIVGVAKNTDDTLGNITEKLNDVHTLTYKIDKEVALQKAAFD